MSIKSVSKLGGGEVTQTMNGGGPSPEQKLQKPAITTRSLGRFLKTANRSAEAREALEKETPGSRRGAIVIKKPEDNSSPFGGCIFC